MKTLTKRVIPGKKSDIYVLYYLTDWHVGAKAFDEKQFRADVAEIAANPLALWIGGGDFIDAVCRAGDKRYDEETIAPWLHGKKDVMAVERDYALELSKPIMDKCVALVKGNHEKAAEVYYDRDIYWDFVCRAADAARVEPGELALGYQGFVRLIFERHRHRDAIDIYCHHGYGGGRLPGGDALALGRVLGDYECSLALMGHRHTFHTLEKEVVSVDRRGNVRQQTRRAAFVGSYLAAYIQPSTDSKPVDTYAEAIGLPPKRTGTTRILIQPEDHKMAILSGDALL